MPKQIFVNLPVKDLKRSMDFFAHLGFSFNPDFTDEKAACMIIEENIFAMLLTEEYFASFINKPVNDAHKSAEVILALSAGSREEVDELVRKAVEAGGTVPREKQDYGWMYGHGFQDLDGHLWEAAYMDMSKFGQQ